MGDVVRLDAYRAAKSWRMLAAQECDDDTALACLMAAQMMEREERTRYGVGPTGCALPCVGDRVAFGPDTASG